MASYGDGSGTIGDKKLSQWLTGGETSFFVASKGTNRVCRKGISRELKIDLAHYRTGLMQVLISQKKLRTAFKLKARS
jgi:hypothetical protein